MANVDHISRGGFSVVEPIRNFFASIVESVEMSRRCQQTFDELDQLSDRDLADLGISRADISRIAYESVYGAN